MGFGGDKMMHLFRKKVQKPRLWRWSTIALKLYLLYVVKRVGILTTRWGQCATPPEKFNCSFGKVRGSHKQERLFFYFLILDVLLAIASSCSLIAWVRFMGPLKISAKMRQIPPSAAWKISALCILFFGVPLESLSWSITATNIIPNNWADCHSIDVDSDSGRGCETTCISVRPLVAKS